MENDTITTRVIFEGRGVYDLNKEWERFKGKINHLEYPVNVIIWTSQGNRTTKRKGYPNSYEQDIYGLFPELLKEI